MGSSKLCLLLLLSASALAFAQDDQPTCLLAQRYKTLQKYEYEYRAESLNALNGASLTKNGPIAFCKVEVEVPQNCHFVVHTTDCNLMEVVGMDDSNEPIYGSSSSDAFAAEMKRNPLKFVVEGLHDVKLYPEDGEKTNILNFKRGIISAILAPLLEEEKNNKMPTIHGKCKTDSIVSAIEDTATKVTLHRDLSRCDKFVPMRDHTSPLALISGMHYPLAKLIRSSQKCEYKIDNEKKHMTFMSCTENHILIPFSHRGQYGVTNVGKQNLTLIKVSSHNDRIFDRGNIVKDLHMEAVEDKSYVQDKEAGLKFLRELATLPENEGERRVHLFNKLVSVIRGMKLETLRVAIPEALEVSPVLTYQVLAQCGTPQCSSAIMQILRTFKRDSLEVDATVFALGLVSNPSALLINDILQMAKHKPSKPIMYALSNAVKRFYEAEGKLIPEIHSVADFMAHQLGDCSGDKDSTFLTLRVTGNMAPAVVPSSPALRSAVLQCINQPAASPAVQQAAIQVYRLIPLPEEARKEFLQVLWDSASPRQKRIAAYLILMKDPSKSELIHLFSTALHNEQDEQVKSFIISHLTNIFVSTDDENKELRQKLRIAAMSNVIGPIKDPKAFSRSYKFRSLQTNMIFEDTGYLPKEVMLEMTLKAFGFDIDMIEIGMEGKGFEPTVDALFGKNGFFPDTTLKTMYFVSDNMPQKINEILQEIMPRLKGDRMKTQNLMKEIGNNVNKLISELKTADTPEAMVYLRLLGNELGYLETSDIKRTAYSALTMIDSMFKMFPIGVMKALMTNTDNTFFAYYILMDNDFFLPTVTGVPLRISLSGTFAPGIKGGLQKAHGMGEVTVSAGIEFVTRIGSHIPEYGISGFEMNTNIFHESGLRAKISIGQDNVKLSIPAPKSPTKLFKMTNNLVAVTGSEEKPISFLKNIDVVDVSKCRPCFAGMKFCTALKYSDAFSEETAPYFPITGESKFLVELHPTGEVTEYTATLSYELLGEGVEGRQKVDAIKFILKADGAEPTEARAIMKYNRRRNTITADIEIPDYDVEAGVRLGVVDGNAKDKGTHSITLDFINKNIPQLSLTGRANLKAMKKGMFQVQLKVPSIKADAKVTAKVKYDEEMELELESDIEVMDASFEQKIEMKYDDGKIEVEVKSDASTKTTFLPNYSSFRKYGNEILDMQVGKTDMKVRHIFIKFVEAVNNYIEKYGHKFSYMQNFRVPDMPEISLPETLFLNSEAKAVYHISPHRFTVALPLPLGGMSTDELDFPDVLTTPRLSLPQFGLEMASMEIPIPELAVPERFTLSIPLFSKVEFSAMMKSNLYDMEASVAVGRDQVDYPSYSAKFDIKGNSPFDIFSVELEGSAMVAKNDDISAQLKASLDHSFIKASININENAFVTDKINFKSSSKIEASSPFGLSVTLQHTGLAGLNTKEMTANNSFDGLFTAGSMFVKTISTQSFSLFPLRPEAKIDSLLQFNSPIIDAKNQIVASIVNGEVSAVSKTTAFEDTFTHDTELSFKDSKLSMKSSTNTFAFGTKIHNQVEASAGAGVVLMKVETNADLSENRVYSLLTTSLDAKGLAVNSDANVKFFENEAIHKATLRMNKDGLTTNGTTTLHGPISLENTFNAGLDASKIFLTISNKAAMDVIKFDNVNNLIITVSSLEFNSKAETTAREHASYMHDVLLTLKPYTATAIVKTNLKLLSAHFLHEAKLQAEPFKIDFSGGLKATDGEEEIKHAYQISYADMSVNAKCSTSGKFLGTYISQNTELDVVGLAARISTDARFNSQILRYDHTIRCSIVPYDLNIDAIFNADGVMNIYGKQSAQLFGKFLLRAQYLSFASSHEYRASTNQQLNNGFSLKTSLDNKFDTLLSPQDQKMSFRMKSKMNNHAFNQNFEAYNTAEKSGVEVSGTIFTNIINRPSPENQEFSILGYLKYDKNTDSHIINFPLIKNLPAFLERIKGLVVEAAEILQDFINNDEIKAKLKALSQHVNKLAAHMNIEGKVIQLKQYFSDFRKITMDDVEMSLRNVKDTVETLLSDLTVWIQHFIEMTKKNYESLVQNIQEQLYALIEEYDIKGVTLYVIGTIREIIQEINLEELNDSGFIFLDQFDIDTMNEIKGDLQLLMSHTANVVENFELEKFVAELKSSIKKLVNQIPTEILNDVIDIIREIIQDLDIVEGINALHTNIREMIVKLEADKQVMAVFEKARALFKELSIEENIRDIGIIINNIDIHDIFNEILRDFIRYWKRVKLEEVIYSLKELIEFFVEILEKLIYDEIVRDANIITELIADIANSAIKHYEILQKLQAIRNFVNSAFYLFREFMENLREVKVAEFFKSVKDIFDYIVLNDLKELAEFIKEEILDEFGFEIPAQLDIPEFTILGFHTVKATTISIDDIKQRLIELIDYIINFEIDMSNVDAFFGDLRMNYLPSIPELTLPQITIPKISFPTIPKIPTEKLVESLQVPKVKLPRVPSGIMVPCFGKLYGEIKFHTPIYTLKTSAEFQNFTENAMTPKFTGVFISQGTSPSLEILNYKLDSSVRIALPRMSRIAFAEFVKLNHNALRFDHQASATFYGGSAQAQAKTSCKVTTAPYTANIMNTAFIAVEGGVTATFDTTYNHEVDIPFPFGNIRTDATLTQKSLLNNDGNTLTLKVDNSGKFDADHGNHNSKLLLSLSPRTVRLTFSGNTDCLSLKTKQSIDAVFNTSSILQFDLHNEAEVAMIKSSLLTASGVANLGDMSVEMKVKQDTELNGDLSGVLSSAMTINAHPGEIVFNFQNKANTKVHITDLVNAKINLQNDYSANFSPFLQQMNTLFLAHLNQYKMLYNVTLNNNEKEAAIFFTMENEANLDFLKNPISIPEIALPFVDFRTPAISDLNLYEEFKMNSILITTDQTLNLNAKMVYQKSQADPLVEVMDIVLVPSVGNLITEMSLKSAIINMNVNAGLSKEDDFVFHTGATSTSVYEALNIKLDGTTSLTTRRGIKLANSLSLENSLVGGIHKSTISMSTDTFETDVSVATNAKVTLPILKLEANQTLIADTTARANVISSLKIHSDFTIPLIKAAGKADLDHILKLEGAFAYFSMATSTKAKIDGRVHHAYLIFGSLDNEASLFLNEDSMRSTLNITADAKLNHGTAKVITLDVIENIALEASMNRVYGMVTYTSNNEANLFNVNTKGKHNAFATINIEPIPSLSADIEIYMSQVSNLGDLTFTEKTTAEMTAAKQRISMNAKFASPLYTTDLNTEVKGIAPVFEVIFKSSATSDCVVLEYDMDASFITSFENDALNVNSKIVLTHADLIMDVNNVITQAMRRQADDSVPHHTLNVDITSPTFTDVNIHYAARKDGISASVSSPSSGFLALQFNAVTPPQLRVYSRYPSTPQVDTDILVIRSGPKGSDKMNLQIVYSMEAPKEMLSGIKMRLPSINSKFKMFADKYHVTTSMGMLQNSVINYINETYYIAHSHDVQLSQMSVFFRNTIVRYHNNVQAFLDAVIRFLRETQFKMPGSDEITTLPEIVKKLTTSVAAMLDATIQGVYEDMQVHYDFFIDRIHRVKLHLSSGDEITGDQIIDQIKALLNEGFGFVKDIVCLDTILLSLRDMLKAVVEASQEFVDSIQSDFLDEVFFNINLLYREIIKTITNIAGRISMSLAAISIEDILDVAIYHLDQFSNVVYGLQQEASEDVQRHMKVRDGKIEIEIPLHFQQ
ncbi:apolipoprotein Bb, tandem duplicate 1 [Pholidichthys leucotaenia]